MQLQREETAICWIHTVWEEGGCIVLLGDEKVNAQQDWLAHNET